MSSAYPELCCKAIFVIFKMALSRNHFECSLNRSAFAYPGRRHGSAFWSASHARTIACLLRTQRIRKKLDIFSFRLCGANGTTVYSRCLHPDEKLAIKPWVTCQDCLVIYVRLSFHRLVHNPCLQANASRFRTSSFEVFVLILSGNYISNGCFIFDITSSLRSGLKRILRSPPVIQSAERRGFAWPEFAQGPLRLLP